MSIRVENLSHIYSKGSPFEKPAIKDISLKIENGEFVAVIGHTGSGKSTLVQHFNGLLKPTSGKVIVDGIDTSSKNLKELRSIVGMVFQYPEHQLFEETVYSDIAFAPLKRGKSEAEVKEIVLNCAKLVGLREDNLQKSPFELSGGQKRRTAIAGVLAMEPKILVLDEPGAGLDPVGREEIFSLLKRLNTERKMTIVIVSHSMEDIARYADRIFVMHEGTLAMQGTPADVFGTPGQLESIGLAAPQVTYFMKELKKLYDIIDDSIYTTKDAEKEIIRKLGDRL